MKRTKLIMPFSLACGMLLLSQLTSEAAEDQENLIGGVMIYDRFWQANEFPLKWHFSQDGIINNDAVGVGTAAVSNANARTEINQAIGAWVAVGTADVSFAYQGETATVDTGCDRINVVTWSDTADFIGEEGNIGRGITTRYIGPNIPLNDVNRSTVTCGDGTVMLDYATYPNGTVLQRGVILDMDLSYNSSFFDFVTTPNVTARVVDIEAVAIHELGHMQSFSHTSLAYTAHANRATMYPIIHSNSIDSQTEVKSLELDDRVSVGRRYPSTGFWPGGSTPYTTGAISGQISMPDGTAIQGARVWVYAASDTTHPILEAYSATDHDWDTSINAGDYILPGLPAGNYYVCIVPWLNGLGSDDPANNNFNRTATANNATGFNTECYQDIVSGFATPDFTNAQTVTVSNGATTENINFVTGVQQTDIMLVMDGSNSMNLPSGTPSVTKIQALQTAANEFIDYLDLDGGHRLGLVQFEETLVSLTPVFNLQALDSGSVGNSHDAINTMSAGGWTNIIAGVEEGITQLADIIDPAPTQLMLLFSDGKHNRPVGSDLNVIHDQMVDNDITFYSVGFGTDINDSILSGVALDSGGIHVNEQDMDALSLSKHFLTIAAHAADDSIVIDPRYLVTTKEKAELKVPVSVEDRSLTIATNWVTRDAKRIQFRVITPNGQCSIDSTSPAIQYRQGDSYQLLKIPLPYQCGGQSLHSGTWRVEASGIKFDSGDKEEVDIVVFANSKIRLFSKTRYIEDRVLLIARLVDEGRVQHGVKISAYITLPLTITSDSEKEDHSGKAAINLKKKRPELTVEKIPMYDDGKHQDGSAGDGIYGTLYVPKFKGPHQVRFVSWYKGKHGGLKREAINSFIFPPPKRQVTSYRDDLLKINKLQKQ